MFLRTQKKKKNASIVFKNEISWPDEVTNNKNFMWRMIVAWTTNHTFP